MNLIPEERERKKKLASTGLELLRAVNLICLERFYVSDITARPLRLPRNHDSCQILKLMKAAGSRS